MSKGIVKTIGLLDVYLLETGKREMAEGFRVPFLKRTCVYIQLLPLIF